MATPKSYGICYMGSKNALAERIVALLPSASHLIDVFAGGCAITHCAMKSGKWQHVHANDINEITHHRKTLRAALASEGLRIPTRIIKNTYP